MKAEIAVMTAEHIDMDAIARGGEILKNGGLVAFPTETVYGLGGNALDPKASMKIYAAKGRPSDNPLIVHIADIRDLDKIVTEVPEKARILAEKYWPGPLTMILPKADIVPKETTGGLDSVAVRFPSDPIAQELILAAGGYVAAPSANTSGRPSPTTAGHVAEDLGEAIDMIIDGGQVNIGLESTIVDFTEDIPVVLRPGYISLEMLQTIQPRFEALEPWEPEGIKAVMTDLAAELEVKNAKIMWPVRIAIAGKAVTPGGAVEIAHILGKEESIARMKQGIEKLSV